jgi:hypothetical protein
MKTSGGYGAAGSAGTAGMDQAGVFEHVEML